MSGLTQALALPFAPVSPLSLNNPLSIGPVWSQDIAVKSFMTQYNVLQTEVRDLEGLIQTWSRDNAVKNYMAQNEVLQQEVRELNKLMPTLNYPPKHVRRVYKLKTEDIATKRNPCFVAAAAICLLALLRLFI